MNRFERFLFRKVEVWLAILIALVLAVAIAAYSLWAYKTRAFPFGQLRQIAAFIAADGEINPTSLFDKLVNDFGGPPKRFVYQSAKTPFLDDAPAVGEAAMFAAHRSLPRAKRAADARFDDYVLIYGVLDLAESRFGALLIDPTTGDIVRRWPFDPEFITGAPHKSGFDPSSGKLFHTLGDNSIAAVNYCGGEDWRVFGGWPHHSIEPDGKGAIWHLDQLDLVRRAVGSGEELRRISILDVLAANPDHNFLTVGLPQFRWRLENLKAWRQSGVEDVVMPNGQVIKDPFHLNDAQPAPAYYAKDGREYLGVSARRLNAVFTIDVETLKIRDALVGRTSRQHDIDFNPAGEITVFDNRGHIGPVRIVAWRPEDRAFRTAWDGADFGQYNPAHGNVVQLGPEDWLVVDHRGRVIVTEAGAPAFIFENSFSDTEMMELRNAWPLPREDFARLEASCR